MKNKKIVKELKKNNLDDRVKITLDLYKKSLLEICYHSGSKFDKKFTCDTETIWRGATLVTEEMSLGELVELLESKDLSEMQDLDFEGLSIEESTDGGVEVTNIEWETPLTEEEELEFNSNDLYWDSEITDSELSFGPNSISSISIENDNINKIITNEKS